MIINRVFDVLKCYCDPVTLAFLMILGKFKNLVSDNRSNNIELIHYNRLRGRRPPKALILICRRKPFIFCKMCYIKVHHKLPWIQ